MIAEYVRDVRGCARIVTTVLAVAGCAHGPKRNEVVAKSGRKVKADFQATVSSATFCATCGQNAPVTVEFGAPPRVRVSIPLCYAHAHSKIGDHDHISIELLDGAAVAATEGELDIDDCTSKHLTATLWAKFPGERRIEAQIDTELVEPGASVAPPPK